jgi:plastocyanin
MCQNPAFENIRDKIRKMIVIHHNFVHTFGRGIEGRYEHCPGNGRTLYFTVINLACGNRLNQPPAVRIDISPFTRHWDSQKQPAHETGEMTCPLQTGQETFSSGWTHARHSLKYGLYSKCCNDEEPSFRHKSPGATMRKGTFSKSVAPILVLIGTFFFQILAFQAHAEDLSQAVTLTLGDYRFEPDSIEVQSSHPVVLTLINKDGITPHNFTLQDTAARLGIDIDVSAGSTSIIEFNVEKPGAYTFYCDKKLPFMKSHRAHGMEGTLIVR